MTTHGGYTLLLANNPVFWNEVVLGPPRAAWDGKSLAAWQAMVERELRQAGIDPTDELARDRWMRNRAISNIRQNPGLFLHASLYRLHRFWAVAPIGPSATHMPLVVRWSVGLFYAFVLLLAVLGTIAWWRNAHSPATPPPLSPSHPTPKRAIHSVQRALLATILGFTLVHAVYWTDTRMRAPLVPAIAILAAGGLRGIPKILRAPSQKKSS